MLACPPPTQRLRRKLGTWCHVACASLLVACGGEGEPKEVLSRSDAAGPVVSPPVFGGETATGGGSGEPDPATPEEVDAFPDQSSTAFQIFVDPPRSVSVYCGDGVYDPTREECDDGPGSTLDVCTPNCQTRDLLAVPLAQNSAAASRHLGSGRHPLSLGVTTDDAGRRGVGALVWTEAAEVDVDPGVSGSAPRVVAQVLDGHGNPSTRVVVADAASTAAVGGNPLLAANPVSAVLPDGSIIVAYNDLNGDGSELGVGLRQLTSGPSTWSVGPLDFVNQTFLGAQQDPDLIWTGTELIAAWVDLSNPSTAPDVRLRRYGEGLTSLGGEETLAGSAAPEGGVALTPWSRTSGSSVEHTYAAVWREALPSGTEALVVWHDEATVRIVPPAPLMPGAELDRPAMAPLDANHLAVAFSVGTDPQLSGVANVFRVQLAVVNVTTGLVVSQQTLAATAGDTKRNQTQPALVAVVNPATGSLPTGQVFLAFRTDGALGAANGEDLWLQRLDWNGTALSLALPATPLPRTSAAPLDHDPLDQRTPVLASLPVPGGAALGIAWEDFGQTFGAAQARPDIALQVAPAPVRRGPPVEKTCSAGSCVFGEGPCASSAGCAAGLSCIPERGPWFGYGPETAVCVAPTCVNGVQDGSETGVDCGGTCGTCFACPGQEYDGTAHYCSAVCDCDNLTGDCDSDLECSGNLQCESDVGELVGLPGPIDLCVFGHCVDETRNADEVRLDCGGNDCIACENGSETFCVGVACAEGEGNCLASGANCVSGLSCLEDQAPLYGISEEVGVCLPSACSTRGQPDVAGFCQSSCRCPDGHGFCTADNQCLTGRCEPERGLYFGLEAEAGLCMPDRCFNGVQDAGEVQVDCGGVCGTECPACPVNRSFRSFEVSNDWGTPTWNAAGAVNHPATISSSTVATEGAASLKLNHCNFLEVHSIPVSSSKFEIVGDELLVDVRIDIGSTGPAWDWLGDFALDVYSAKLGRRPLIGRKVFDRGDAGQWVTFTANVTEDIRLAFLDADEQLSFRLRVNRSCTAAGSGTGAVLVDNLRFGGTAAFRSECAAGGNPAAPGTGPTAGGSVALLAMDAVSGWDAGTTVPTLSTSDKSQGTGSMTVPAGYAQIRSGTFAANLIGLAETLQVDVRVPAALPGLALGGTLDVHVACPAAGLPNTYVGTWTFWDKPTATWITASLTTPHAVRVALASSVTDCRFTLTTNTWNHRDNFVRLDNVRFEVANPCTAYTQQSATPFSVGMPTVPNGTQARPWPLCTAAQVQTVMNTSTLWGDHFALYANINLSGLTGQIGNATTAFSGTFDGNGFTLYGYSRTGTTDVGLFGVVNGDGNLDGTADGFVRDLTLSGITVTGTTRVGALAGSFTGRVQGVTLLGGLVNTTTTAGPTDIGGLIGRATATVVASNADVVMNIPATSGGSNIGGFAGTCQSVSSSGSSGSMTKTTTGATGIGGLCGSVTTLLQRTTSTTVVNTYGQSVGGLAGLSSGIIEDSAAYGRVTPSGTAGSNAGGLVGRQTAGTIRRSSAAGNVITAGTVAGGLVGLSENGIIQDSYATGAVQAVTGAGGLVGTFNGPGTITRTYARGVITAAAPRGAFAGTIVGTPTTSSYVSSTANSGMTRVGTGTVSGITNVTDAQLALQATYSGWSFTTVWIMGSAGAELR